MKSSTYDRSVPLQRGLNLKTLYLISYWKGGDKDVTQVIHFVCVFKNEGVKNLFIESYYIINQHMMYMIGFLDRYGNICTRVIEVGKDFIVDKSPLEILEDSIKCIGFDLRGAMATAKWILGDIQMCPVMISPIHKICVFPHRSAKHIDTIWFNPDYIARTSSLNGNTNIEFRNGHTLHVPSRLSSFNHKLKTAEQLQNITVEIGKNPISLVLEPKKKRLLLSQ